MDETPRELRKLASRLPKYLYLIPLYTVMARIFRLPFRAEILAASKALKGLANGIQGKVAIRSPIRAQID